MLDLLIYYPIIFSYGKQIIFLLPKSWYAAINTKHSTYNLLNFTRHKERFMKSLTKKKIWSY